MVCCCLTLGLTWKGPATWSAWKAPPQTRPEMRLLDHGEDTSVETRMRSLPPPMHIWLLTCLLNLVFDHFLLTVIKICPKRPVVCLVFMGERFRQVSKA